MIPPPVAAFLAKPAFKIGAAVVVLLAIAGLVVGAFIYIDGVRDEGFKAGKAETEVQVITNTVIVKEKIQRAEERGPRTRRDASDRMRAGSF